MAKYLNAAQKQALVLLIACAQFLDRAIEHGAGKMPRPVGTNIKRARTFAWKAAQEWLQSTDEKSQRAVLNLIKDTELGVVTRQEAQKLKDLERYIMGREYAERLAEQAMAHSCKGCDGTPRENCPIYESLRHYEIPAWDEAHPKCEYAGAGAV